VAGGSRQNWLFEYARIAKQGKGWPFGDYPKCPQPQVALAGQDDLTGWLAKTWAAN
jgi:hypothetical protein